MSRPRFEERASTRFGKQPSAAHGLLISFLAYSRNQVLEPTVLQFNAVLEDMDDILRRVLGEDIALDLLLDPNLGWVKVDRGQLQQIVLNLAGTLATLCRREVA